MCVLFCLLPSFPSLPCPQPRHLSFAIILPLTSFTAPLLPSSLNALFSADIVSMFPLLSLPLLTPLPCHALSHHMRFFFPYLSIHCSSFTHSQCFILCEGCFYVSLPSCISPSTHTNLSLSSTNIPHRLSFLWPFLSCVRSVSGGPAVVCLPSLVILLP